MKNVVAVLLACLGLYGAVWAAAGSVRVAAGVAGGVLFVASVAILVDLEDVT